MNHLFFQVYHLIRDELDPIFRQFCEAGGGCSAGLYNDTAYWALLKSEHLNTENRIMGMSINRVSTQDRPDTNIFELFTGISVWDQHRENDCIVIVGEEIVFFQNAEFPHFGKECMYHLYEKLRDTLGLKGLVTDDLNKEE